MNLKEFDNIYNKIYSKYYMKYENIRRRITKRYIVTAVCLTIFSLVLVAGRGSSKSYIYILTAIPFIGIAAYNIEKNRGCRNDFIKTYKRDVIGEFMDYILPEAKYNPSKNILMQTIIEQKYKKIFEDQVMPTSYRIDDTFEYIGTNFKFNMCDMEVGYDENDEQKIPFHQPENIFQGGLVAYVELNYTKHLNIKILNKKIFKKESTVLHKMDNDEFNNNFDIIATSRIDAYTILTHEIIELLNQQIAKYNIKFDIIVLENKIFFRFHTGNLFEPSFLENVILKERFEKYAIILNFILDFTDRVVTIYNNI